MLVLARKKGESIIIGDNIELIVLSVEGDTVRLGINAPKSVEIYRKEIYDSIQESNKEAIQTKVATADLHKLLKKDES
ncbi:carbon storage regulator CsrA [Cohnella silvisoli]|uniref:Translational regulator CsrA n=1 Tax=Cohnella silvisoli TaxID=2873699 RepID=A0ABV1KQ83_9BACL|nr:carbon storage regulator CsrA [Cohnella silvisoli]MCD9022308.1 carbon storage regulator CsrA [Cohnella silvisoli]